MLGQVRLDKARLGQVKSGLDGIGKVISG